MMQQAPFNQQPPVSSATLFLGDLSIFCNEHEIYKFFEPYGPIESIQLKRCEKKKPHLSYGFIKFAYRQSAEEALKKVNGSIFLGRAIRVGWAFDNPAQKSSLMRQLETKNIKQTAQIHVTFCSRNPHVPVTETTLRDVFGQFGEVVDVTINKTLFSADMRTQSGYGFVHYLLNDDGISSALNAISSMNHTVKDYITYECTVSHGLENYLNARRSGFVRDDRSSFGSTHSHSSHSLGSTTAASHYSSFSSTDSGRSHSFLGEALSPRPQASFHSMLSDDNLLRSARNVSGTNYAIHPPASVSDTTPHHHAFSPQRQEPSSSSSFFGHDINPSGFGSFSIPNGISSQHKDVNWNVSY